MEKRVEEKQNVLTCPFLAFFFLTFLGHFDTLFFFFLFSLLLIQFPKEKYKRIRCKAVMTMRGQILREEAGKIALFHLSNL